jgi:polyhydroxyalkanoate synthesis regulator phasin
VRKCAVCSKVCKSKVEEEQHVRFTEHDRFEEVELSMGELDPHMQGAGAGDVGAEAVNVEASDEESVVALVSMGFSRNKALRALHFSQDGEGRLESSGAVERAIEWISLNEDDEKCSDEPFVKPPKLTHEEAKAKAEELIRKAKAKREQEEKAMEKIREAERIRSGKEMAAIARKEEEQRLKRMVEERAREKKEEALARQKIRQKLEQDRMERRARMGIPVDDKALDSIGSGGPGTLDVDGRDANASAGRLPVKPREKGDALRGLLVSLKKSNSNDSDVTRAFETLNKLVGNVARDPSNQKFRTIKLENKAIQERVGRHSDAVEFLRICGWTDAESNVLTLEDARLDVGVLTIALENIESALTNPFFGCL